MSVYTDLCITDGATWGTVFGEPSGTTCTDFVGGTNATYSGSPTLGGTSGAPIAGTTYATFAAASSQYASAADNAKFDMGTADFSIELVFKVPASTASRQYLIAHDGNNGAGDWSISVNALLLQSALNGTGYNELTNDVTANAWEHWVFAFDRDGNAVYYRNGSSSSSRSIAAQSGVDLSNTGTFYLARRQSTGYFDGPMAAAVIYKGVLLDGTKALAHYNAMDDVLSSSSRANRRGLLGVF